MSSLDKFSVEISVLEAIHNVDSEQLCIKCSSNTITSLEERSTLLQTIPNIWNGKTMLFLGIPVEMDETIADGFIQLYPTGSLLSVGR